MLKKIIIISLLVWLIPTIIFSEVIRRHIVVKKNEGFIYYKDRKQVAKKLWNKDTGKCITTGKIPDGIV